MTQHITLSAVSQLRRDAKRLARQQSLTHSQALDQIARGRGFSNWSLLVKHCEDSTPATLQAVPLVTPAQVQQALGLPNMKVNSADYGRIVQIVQRFSRIVSVDMDVNNLELLMDLAACHNNGCPLDLVALAEAPRDEDIVHDVGGITRYINRETGRLENGFRPRYGR